MLPFVNVFRDVLVTAQVPPASRLLECTVIGLVTFALCYAYFERIKGRVVEEL